MIFSLNMQKRATRPIRGSAIEWHALREERYPPSDPLRAIGELARPFLVADSSVNPAHWRYAASAKDVLQDIDLEDARRYTRIRILE